MTDALAAALLANQRGQQRYDPADRSRKYAQALLAQGSQVTPVGHPVEGIARALQGAFGGYIAGAADREQKANQQKTLDSLAAALGANSPDEMRTALSGVSADSDIAGPVMAMMVGERQKQLQAGRAADAFTGAVQAPPPGTQVAGPAGPTSLLPTGTPAPGGFNNNLGNIRSGAGLPDEGAPQNGFATFPTPQAGANAMVANLGAYVKQNPNMTVAQAISKWAPPNENDTQTYINQVAEGTGINPGAPLAGVLKDPAVNAQLLDAITRKEKGGLPQGVTADTFMSATSPRGPQVAQGDSVTGPAADASGNPIPPQESSVPDVPRPTPSPEQLKKYDGLIRSGDMTAAQARQALDQELQQEWTVQRENRRLGWQEGRKQREVADQREYERQRTQDQRQYDSAFKPTTNDARTYQQREEAEKRAYEAKRDEENANRKAQTELTQKAPMELIGRRTDSYEKEIRPKGEAAVQEVNSIHQVRQLLDAGAFTGTGADAQAAGSRMAQALGIDWGADKQANTAALQSAVGNRVLSLVKNLGAGAGISNADREYASKIAGGDVSVGEPAMRKILDIGERAARANIKTHDTEAARIKKLPGVSQLGDDYFALPNAPTYDEWSKANPMPHAAAPAAPAQGEITATGPGGQKAVLRNGQWVIQ